MKRFFPAFAFAFFLCFGTMVFSQEYAGEVQFPPGAVLSAAYIGDVEMLKIILETDPDTEVRDSLGGTALHVAIFQNNLEILKLLLEHGFDVNAAAANGYTPLHYCVWINNLDAARILLAYNADKTKKDHAGLTPADKAAKEGKRDMILLFLRQR